ncbi:FISUMP domain-containing protein [uncultured Fibrobacter sp.]|uniref:FISUMP domain-containing protein n=1 Tax=uncultured Fibrobacter sp. TaxID=261512 RepID=UPI0026103D20|nr:FISUMP domain-containing protein [uncultured Fibrobacter sp.]
MKSFLIALLAGMSLSFAIESIPISDVKASANLLDQGKNTYRPENLVMKKKVHPFYQVWAATYKEKPITLEFTIGAQRLDMITIYNGYMRDSASYVNNALAKTIKIYDNTKNNLIKTVTLAKPKWGGYKHSRADIVAFEKPLENVHKIIIEIQDIYPGKKTNDVSMAMVKFWGFVKAPRKFKTGQMKDPRDGQTYGTLRIGGQTWMSQDLRYRTPDSRPFANPAAKKLVLPPDAGFEYPESDIEQGVCPGGWRLPTRSEYMNLRSELSANATMDDYFSMTPRRFFYSIHESEGTGGRSYKTDIEDFFFPTDAYGLNFSTLTRRYYDGECSEEGGELYAISSYWTMDSKEVPLWPDENGNIEMKSLRHYRFGGTDYCEAMQCTEDYHFVRCVKGGTLADSRDGRMYKTVRIGNQTWMAENLKYDASPSFCYEGNPENCATYGRMYTWESAQTACPDGWHLPSIEEFRSLVEGAGGKKDAARRLMAIGAWTDEHGKRINGADDFSFAALPAGYAYVPAEDGSVPSFSQGQMTSFWTTSRRTLDFDGDTTSTAGEHFMLPSLEVGGEEGYDGVLAVSVRCLKD